MTLATADKLQHLKTIIELSRSKDLDSEQVFMINNVDWNQYEKLLNFVGDNSGIFLKYWEGNLEIMSPSIRHEVDKKLIGILLETYLLERRIRFYPLGSTTLRRETLKRGIEPDQCYCINRQKDIPDLAIEVIITSGGIDSLEIYQGLGVTEVWFWQRGKLRVYVLREGEYVGVNQSSLLPDLDLDLLAIYITHDGPFDAVLEFREKIRAI